MAVQTEVTRGATGLCLEVHDLLVSKAIAGREKDRVLLGEAARHRLADREALLQRPVTVEVEPAVREEARRTIERAFRSAR